MGDITLNISLSVVPMLLLLWVYITSPCQCWNAAKSSVCIAMLLGLNLVFAGTLFPRCFSSVSEAPCGISTLLSFTVSMAFDLILPLMLRLQILCFFILRRLIFAKHGRG